MTCKILQWNIRGMCANFEELKILLSSNKVPLAALQECKTAASNSAPRGYSLLSGNSPNGEAALLVNNELACTEIELNTQFSAAAATICLGKTFTVCSLYLHKDHNVTKRAFTELINQLPRPFLILGDFNAHSPLWGDHRLDDRGSTIEEILDSLDLILLNSKTHTFIHSAYHSPSAIDLSVASPTISLDFNWSVHDDLCGSDHFPIFLSLPTEADE